MKIRLLLPILIITALAFLGVALAQTLSASDIAKRSLELDRTPTKITTYEMTVFNKQGKQKVYQFQVWEKQYSSGAKKLVRFLQPADDAGTGLLTHEQRGADDLQWLFLPSIRKARRLAASDQDSEFMGSDLFFEDMAAKAAEEYEHTLVSETILQGIQCYLVDSVPKPGINSAYARSRSWIDKATFVGHKIELYDKNGKLLKTMTVKRAEQIDGIWTITEAEIVRVNMQRAKTILKLLQRQYNVNIPDNYFTTQFLERF